jgi:hypothetical protein
MGVERAVTRWYVHRQLRLQSESIKTASSTGDPLPDPATSGGENEQREAGHSEVTSLGPCPKPMMG